MEEDLLTAFQGSAGDRGWEEKGMATPLEKTQQRRGTQQEYLNYGLLLLFTGPDVRKKC